MALTNCCEIASALVFVNSRVHPPVLNAPAFRFEAASDQ